MIVTEKIDWLSVTYPPNVRLIDTILPHSENRMSRVKSPIPVYEIAYQIEPFGVKVLQGDERLGTHVIYSGKVLDAYRDFEIDMLDIWEKLTAHHGTVSRIDLAVDVYDEPRFSPYEVQRENNFGSPKTQLKGDKFIGSRHQTETYYLGSMTSKNRKFRVYNKAVEQGILDKYWIRIEYEKRRNAHKTAQTVFDNGQSIRSVVKSVVDFPEWELWQAIFNCDVAVIERNEKPVPEYVDKLHWIVDTVAPAIANAIELEKKASPENFTLDKCKVLDALAYALTNEINKRRIF